MSTEGQNTTEAFPYPRWEGQLDELARKYQQGDPFPHIVLEDFHDADTLRKVHQEFPNPGDQAWIQYKHFNENKLGFNKRSQMAETVGKVIDEMNSPRFVAFLSRLIGIENLLPDPDLDGGGMHQSGKGGFLKIHADFTTHHKKPHWRRRCNVILYLNENWEESWGGHLELWDQDMKNRRARIAPLFNRAVIFNTTDDSHHGHPEPTTCPQDRFRRSLALYYYTEEADPNYRSKSTNYHARPGERWQAPLIWLDKKALAVYSRVKVKLGLSDDFASKVLSFFSRKDKK